MIEIIEGRGVGAGKSYYACVRILSHLSVGGTVFASDTFGIKWDAAQKLVDARYGVTIESEQFQTFPEGDIKRLHEVTPQGTPELPVLIVVDECHGELNARDWADKTKKDFFKWLTQSRHDDNDVIFISQSANNIDKQIARLATYISRVRNMRNFSFPGIGKWPLRQFVVNRFDQDGKTLLDRKWMWHDGGIFGCYESKVMRGSHTRLNGAAIPPRKLSASKTKTHSMAKIIIAILVALAVFAYFKFRESPMLGAKEKASAPAAATPAPAPAPYMKAAAKEVKLREGELAAYSIYREAFRSRSGAYEMTTAEGEYRLGRMSGRGLVVGLQDYVARVVQPDGTIAFVVADAVTAVKPPDETKAAKAPGEDVPPLPAGAGEPLEPKAKKKIMVGGTVRNGKFIPYYAPDYETDAERARAGVKKEIDSNANIP